MAIIRRELGSESLAAVTSTGRERQTQSWRRVSRLVTTGGLLIAFATAAQAQGSRLVADFNGDGLDDLAIGAPTDGKGSVSIFLGVPGGFSTTTPTTPKLVLSSPLSDTGERYGWALAAADFNGDGRSELVVGAPYSNGSRGRIEVLGFRWIAILNMLVLETRAPYVQRAAGGDVGPEANDWFGWALATGDFDGNGYPDLAVGVPAEDLLGVPNVGAVQVLYSGALGFQWARTQLWSQYASGIDGEPQTNDQFGASLAAGDFNGDGLDDLAVGVPLKDGAFVDQGAVNVIRGTSTGLSANNDQLLMTSNDARFDSGQFGYALAAGDVNGDGFTDLAIGAPNGSNRRGFVVTTYGSARRLGALFVHPQTIDPPEYGDLLGYSLAIADFNGDGFADVAAGVPGEDILGVDNAGAVTVFYGQRGVSLDREELWHQNSYGVEDKIEAKDLFGSALAAGDYNGDGLADLAISVPWEDVSGVVDAGATNVIVGQPTGLTAGIDYLLLAKTLTQSALFGLSLR